MGQGNQQEVPKRAPRVIPKHELRKIKQHVSRMRKKGHEVYTDEEVEKEGWVLSDAQLASAIHVEKKRQEKNWDCGLACTQMVLGVLGDGDVRPSVAVLLERLASPSVWTIDLAYLLTEHHVECEYLTAAALVDASAYQNHAFYTASLDEDAHRVQLLFQAAAVEGVQVSIKTLSAAELWNLMREEETLVIALVDAGLLYSRAAASSGQGSASGGQRAFMGHYVLLLGLDDVRGGFIINDPGRDDERTFVHTDSLEAARLADGTDQDLILIPIYQQHPPSTPTAGTVPKILAACEGRKKSP